MNNTYVIYYGWLTDDAGGGWRIDVERFDAERIPATLTAVLLARLDGLSEPQRRALQHAAVVGRIFWDAAVAAINQFTASPAAAGLSLGFSMFPRIAGGPACMSDFVNGVITGDCEVDADCGASCGGCSQRGPRPSFRARSSSRWRMRRSRRRSSWSPRSPARAGRAARAATTSGSRWCCRSCLPICA